jgi:hypothetical protein
MTNWKCSCGVVNFATDAGCKRCGIAKPAPTQFYEYEAPNGDAVSGLLKATGIAILCGAFLLAYSILAVSTQEARNYAIMLAGFFAAQGVVICALFIGFGIVIENLVAIRKNTQHLAGIRENAVAQTQYH